MALRESRGNGLLAQMYLYGIIGRSESGARDYRKAYELFHECSELGDIRATSFLAHCYRSGVGCEVDKDNAAKLFAEVASSENGRAMYLAAQGYTHHSWGFQRDDDEALIWYQRSANLGYPLAVKALERRYNISITRDVSEIDQYSESSAE